MRDSGESPDRFFHRHRGERRGRKPAGRGILGTPAAWSAHPYWDDEAKSMLIDEVEAIWAAIDERAARRDPPLEAHGDAPPAAQ